MLWADPGGAPRAFRHSGPPFLLQIQNGSYSGSVEPAQLFNDMVLTPYREAKFTPHAGPFLFEFQRHGLSPEAFLSRLDGFFIQLPKDFHYAVEIRNPGLLGPAYHAVLDTHGVAHVYNH